MARLKLQLSRNLRRSILRGHPWIYKEALAPLNAPSPDRAQLALLSDGKGELAWAIYDPHGPLALRILSTDKAPPSAAVFERRFARALDLRRGVRSAQTNAYRLFNGEGDLLPGLVCDVYGRIAVVQFDGQGPSEFWNRDLISGWILRHAGCDTVVEKSRGDQEVPLRPLGGEIAPAEIEIVENGARFLVHLEKGQKTGFFLDQRDNRRHVGGVSAGKSLLNLFSYSGGFSVYAGRGGAARVASVDISRGAIAMAEENWRLNGLPPDRHEGLCVDVFDYLKERGESWDHIVVDPPSMSHAEGQRAAARDKYIELFAAAARRVADGGEISLSSCSSHVSFTDFFAIIEEALSSARRRGRILRVSGQGADHPFPHAAPELRYLKFVHLVLE
jgi:23S rRNA (cytosine1962-C5)-methyltransferase